MSTSGQKPGLRFDVYERVVLDGAVFRASDWEAFELIPDVRVEVMNGQATVKGCLLLSGYAGRLQGPGAAAALEHRIPVEISIPLDRVTSQAEVRVEVETFDVDFEDDRRLNVSGVLALYGVDLSAGARPAGTDRDVAGPVGSEAGAAGETIDRSEESAEDEESDLRSSDTVVVDGEKPGATAVAMESRTEVAEREAPADVRHVEEEPEGAAGVQTSPSAPDSQPISAPSPLQVRLSAVEPEKQASGEEAARTLSEETQAAAGEKEQWEWKKRFLGSASDEPAFRRVRVCIVQKDETLESIAEKYRVKPQDIAVYNRLADSRVREGQVLYIPVS